MSLVAKPSNIAAELVLNKIMNNQLESTTGKTVTAAGRSMSARLNAMSYEVGAAAGVVASGQGYVIAAQNQVTSMMTKLQEMQKLIAGVAGNSTDFITAGESAKLMMDQIAGMELATINGITLLAGTGKTLQIGMGNTLRILNKTVGTGTEKLKVLQGLVGVPLTSTDQAAWLTAIDDAITQLNGYVVDYSSSYNQLRDRVDVLNDLGQTFSNAAAQQAITAGGGSAALLANIIGNTTT